MAVNLNNAILVPLGGMPVVELCLHVGQRNKVLQDMLLAILEYLDAFGFTGGQGGTSGGAGGAGTY